MDSETEAWDRGGQGHRHPRRLKGGDPGNGRTPAPHYYLCCECLGPEGFTGEGESRGGKVARRGWVTSQVRRVSEGTNCHKAVVSKGKG